MDKRLSSSLEGKRTGLLNFLNSSWGNYGPQTSRSSRFCVNLIFFMVFKCFEFVLPRFHPFFTPFLSHFEPFDTFLRA